MHTQAATHERTRAHVDYAHARNRPHAPKRAALPPRDVRLPHSQAIPIAMLLERAVRRVPCVLRERTVLFALVYAGRKPICVCRMR